MIERFARPYAKAMFQAAGNVEAARTLRSDLGRFADAMVQVPRIGAIAANPGVPAEGKAKAVSKVAASLGLGEPARRALDLFVSRYRLTQLPQILRALDQLIARDQGIVTAEVTAAEQLDQDQLEQLRQALETALQKRVEIELEVDPELLGGFVAVVGSERYDASLAGQLDRMAERMASGGV